MKYEITDREMSEVVTGLKTLWKIYMALGSKKTANKIEALIKTIMKKDIAL